MNNDKATGVLILSHCGLSFVEPIIECLNELGEESYVLSSRIAKNTTTRAEELEQLSDWVKFTDVHDISRDDVDETLKELNKIGKKVIFCISVWEGYRGVMAYVNECLKVNDMEVRLVDLVTDKLKLREALHQLSLSNIKAHILKPRHLNKKYKQAYFVKPRKGLASYGAFKLIPGISWSDIDNIRLNAKKDPEYSHLISREDFIIEPYIYGKEYSFEIIIHQQKVHVIAIHEKLEAESNGLSTVEPGCISPAISLDYTQQENAIAWVSKIIMGLNIMTGCFHVEAKFDGCNWEIIEMNPRIGGSFISQSVLNLTGSDSMLKLWIRLLYSNAKNLDQECASYLENITFVPTRHISRGTFFRVFFANPNCLIKRISLNDEILSGAKKYQVFLKEGDNTPNQSREIFLAQALWFIKSDFKNSLNKLLKQSNKILEIEYE